MRVFFLIYIISTVSLAGDFRYRTQLSPHDYLMRSQDSHTDPVFDQYRTIDLGAEIGVGSDCGRIDFTNTLRASLRNILDTKYFGDLGKNIVASSPMLLACYFSPTWCAILKHSQISAQSISQMRLNQCSIIDKYTDSRVEDFYEARQSCVRKAIEQNGGDLEHAMESCQGNKLWDVDLPNWAGTRKGGESVPQNRLLESSAKWAGLDTPQASDSLNLVKALVGDTVVSKGNVTVEYGPRQSNLTPRTYLQSIEKESYEKLCGKIAKRFDSPSDQTPDQMVSDDELKALSPGFNPPLMDRQTIRALAVIPPRQRAEACKSVSDALAMTMFSTDINRSLDILNTLAQNPNLPVHRRQEVEEKRRALKESVDTTVLLQKQKNIPINTTLSKINEEGSRIQLERIRDSLSNDADSVQMKRVQTDMTDCSDGVFCEGR